jgi:carbon monoxide dehydrogenase subunit G
MTASLEPKFTPEDAARLGTPLLRVLLDAAGAPVGATGCWRIPAPPARVWAVLEDVDRYAGRIPMVDKVVRRGDRVELHLRFRISLFSVHFSFEASVQRDPGRSVDIRWISGEPRNAHIHLELEPIEGGAATLLHATTRYDIDSLGWLVKYFLKHHPEIRYGVHTGSVMTILEAMRNVASPG